MNCETFQTEAKELKKAIAKVRTKTIYFPFSLKWCRFCIFPSCCKLWSGANINGGTVCTL